MYAKLKRIWVLLPALSGVLLVLTFHPFNVWPLGFIALAPLYWFAGGFGHSRTRVFWGGCITGGMFAFALSYYTIIQFHWLPEAYLFVGLIRFLVVPITLLGAVLCGASVVAYGMLRGRNILVNALLAGALYTLSELVLGLLFGGYYLGLLAYAAVPIGALRGIASIGGAHMLTLFIATISGCVAEILIAKEAWRAAIRKALIPVLGATAIVLLVNTLYLYRHEPIERLFSVSVIQTGARADIAFGVEHDGSFFWSEAPILSAAASSSPDLVIYPFAPVEGALYRGEAPSFNKDILVASEQSVGAFLRAVMPTSTALLTWNNLYANNAFFNEYEVWQDGQVVSEYQKRALFPFMDYTPRWAQEAGLFSTPFDVVAGENDNHISVHGVALGDLMCSELHDSSLARDEARRVPLIVAVGSEAMFEDDVASSFSLRAAQLRAIENNVPVVRGNILGPSGIIDRFGTIGAYAPAGAKAILSQTLPLSAPRATLFSIVGSYLVWLCICGILLSAWYVRSQERA